MKTQNNKFPLPEKRNFQVIVVGSGPGGAISACMAAEAGLDVLIIEEGSYITQEDCKGFTTDEMLKKYRNGGLTLTVGRPKVQYVEGRCVGGGSEVNSGLYHRTPPEILEVWKNEYQVDGLTPENLSPHFETHEKELAVSPRDGSLSRVSRLIQGGAKKMNWDSVEVPCMHQRTGSGGADDEFYKSRKTMTRTYIPRALKAGATLLPMAWVRKIKHQNNKWELAVEVTDAKGRKLPIHFTCDQLFLACGAIQTPALLRRSGIKNNIGNSLSLHPTVKIAAMFPEEVNEEIKIVSTHQVREFSPKTCMGSSLSMPSHLAVSLLGYPDGLEQVDQNWKNMALFYTMIAANNRGTIRCLPWFKDPLVRFQLEDKELMDLMEGVKKLVALLFSAGATSLYSGFGPSLVMNKEDDLENLSPAFLKKKSNPMTIHLFSSCPMGENKKVCATDSFGKVFGFSGLYINDASLLCTAPGVNPQGTIMALASRNMQHFLANR